MAFFGFEAPGRRRRHLQIGKLGFCTFATSLLAPLTSVGVRTATVTYSEKKDFHEVLTSQENTPPLPARPASTSRRQRPHRPRGDVAPHCHEDRGVPEAQEPERRTTGRLLGPARRRRHCNVAGTRPNGTIGSRIVAHLGLFSIDLSFPCLSSDHHSKNGQTKYPYIVIIPCLSS